MALDPALSICRKCLAPIPDEYWREGTTVACPRCGNECVGMIFPALYRRPEVEQAELITSTEEASCFYHPQKRALAPCDTCGRFLCALCRIDWGGQSICPRCLQTGATRQSVKSLETRRTLYDSIALAVATVPLLFFYFTLFSAPAAVFLAIRYWNAPSSLIPRTKIRLYLALLFATLQIVGWVWLIAYLIMRVGK